MIFFFRGYIFFMDAPTTTGPTDMTDIAIVTKREHPEAERLGAEIGAWLMQRGANVTILAHDRDPVRFIDALTRTATPGLILVLGGDGTLLSVARKTIGLNAALLGINLGDVGFLTAISPEGWRKPLERVLSGGYLCCEQMVIDYKIVRDGAVVQDGFAINDVVVSRGTLARLVRLSLRFSGETVTTLRSDGLIISSPIGSTAYCASASGPLVHPAVEAFTITAIAAFRNNFKSLVVPASQEMEIVVEDDTGEVFLTEDGQELHELAPGDVIRIRRSRRGIIMVNMPGETYFSTITAKGFLVER